MLLKGGIGSPSKKLLKIYLPILTFNDIDLNQVSYNVRSYQFYLSGDNSTLGYLEIDFICNGRYQGRAGPRARVSYYYL